MRFVVFAGMHDPDEMGFWSGTPKHFILALRRQGHEVITIGPLEPRMPLWGRLKLHFYRRALGKRYLMNGDCALLRSRARQAKAALRRHETADAVIVFHIPDAAYLECNAPIVVVHDATWHQLVDFYPDYARTSMARETMDDGFELDSLALQNCDLALFSSQWAASSATSDYRIDPAKVAARPFGANLVNAPHRSELQQDICRRGTDCCRLLFVGVDWDRKGGDIAVTIAQQLHDWGVAVELQIVGCDPPRAAPHFVRPLGFFSKSDPAAVRRMQRVLADADFFVLPTRADCIPAALLEAAAFGLPAATSGVGGIPEIVGDGRWALALPPGAPAAEYARWIRATYANREVYERMAWAARADFEDRLNWDRYCQWFCERVEGIGKRARNSAPRFAL
jgi:glycosyltransferase involved in cell wall biosynthesis